MYGVQDQHLSASEKLQVAQVYLFGFVPLLLWLHAIIAKVV